MLESVTFSNNGKHFNNLIACRQTGCGHRSDKAAQVSSILTQATNETWH